MDASRVHVFVQRLVCPCEGRPYGLCHVDIASVLMFPVKLILDSGALLLYFVHSGQEHFLDPCQAIN
jgi:hypothetical protein